MNDTGTAQRFADAVNHLESDHDMDSLVVLYATDSVTGNVLRPDAFAGADGARTFWQEYRAQFGDVHSTFRNIVDDGAVAALEWSSEGTVDGRSVQYTGVTMLEYGEAGITRSCAYFDPSSLGAQIVAS